MLMRICPSPSHSGDFTLWTKQLGLSWFPFVKQRFSGKDQQKVTGGASLECHPHHFWGVTQSYRGQSSCVVCSSVKQVLTCHWLFASVTTTRSSGVWWLCAWQSLTCDWFQDFQGIAALYWRLFSADGRSKRRGQDARKDVTGAAWERSTSIHNSLTRVVHIYRKCGLACSQEEEEMGFKSTALSQPWAH